MLLRKIAIALLLTFPLSAFAAFGNKTQWEVRTTGSDSNGGAFDLGVTIPGTDYSQQDSPQVTYTDLTIQTTTTQVRSAAFPFATCTAGSGYCGNFIHITGTVSGSCTTGWYEVLSTSTITATLSSAAGTAASVCNAVLGGGFANVSAAFGLYLSGNTIWVKSGTYSTASTLSWTGTGQAQVTIWGYQTTHGDNTGTKPLITTATNSTPLVAITSAVGPISFTNINFSNTAGTSSAGIYGTSNTNGPTGLVFTRCTLTGFTTAIGNTSSLFNLGSISLQAGTKLLNSTVSGVVAPTNTSGTLTMFDSAIVGSGTGAAIDWTRGSNITAFIARSLIVGHAGGGLIAGSKVPTLVTIENSTFAGLGSDAIQITGAGTNAGKVYVENNIGYNNSGWFLNLNGASADGRGLNFYAGNNSLGSNTSGNYSLPTQFPTPIDATAITVDPFTNSAGGDYSLNNTAGGGAAVRAAAYPGAFTTSTTAYQDNGAIQHQDTGGGGTASNYGFVR